jgi:hypothetical protein
MNTVEKVQNYDDSIGPATYAAPRESSSSWPSRSAGRERAKTNPPASLSDTVRRNFAETQCPGGLALGILQNMRGSD